MIDLNGKTILVTGGTGSFGKNFTRYLLKNYKLKKLIILSRDELKQFQYKNELKSEGLYDNVRFFIGDVRELNRLQRAFYEVDIVVHAAALKQVPTLEYNPYEAVKTNVNGTQNVIEAAIDQGVKKVLLISTDKAAQPVNLYGSTKLCAEKLTVSGNSYNGWRTKFSCVRYGNVIGSRGSIVETLLKKKKDETVTITDKEMTRFWITYEQAINLVLFGLENMEGGEIFIPKVPSMKLMDIFDAILPDNKKEIIGIRPGEKLHEILVTEQEARHAAELDKYFVVIPEFLDQQKYSKYYDKGKKIATGFRYTSDTNKQWMRQEDLLAIVKK